MVASNINPTTAAPDAIIKAGCIFETSDPTTFATPSTVSTMLERFLNYPAIYEEIIAPSPNPNIIMP